MLKADWKPSHDYQITLQLEQSTQVRNRNTDEDFDQELRFRLDFNAAAVPAAAKDQAPAALNLNLELSGLFFELIRGDLPLVHYDSRSRVGLLEDDQRTTEALDKLVGARWRYTVGAEGQVLSAQVDTNGPAGRSLANEPRIAGLTLVRRLFNPYYFQPFLELGWLPGREMKVGDTWPLERQFNAGTVGGVQFKGTCTFKGWQEAQGRRCARFDLAGGLTPAARLPGKLGRVIASASADLEKGTLAGQVWFDPEQNLPVQMVTDLTMVTVTQQRQRKAAGDTSTNAPPTVRLVVPLNQRIKLKIADQGESVHAPPAAPRPVSSTPTPP